MGIVTWDGSLATGIETIDIQHEELFRVINSMYDKMQRGESMEKYTLVEALDSLRSYVKYHFRTEEKLMEDNGYPELEQHRKEHEVFSERMYLFAQRPLDQTAETLEEMQSFLLNWLIKHIQRTDSKYVPYIKEESGSDLSS